MKSSTHRAILLVCFCFGIIAAGPLISGTSGSFNNGSSITITGSGFGTKAKAAPIRWDDFENATVGQTVNQASGGWWNQNSETTWKINSSNQRNNSSRNAIAELYRSGVIYKNGVGFKQSGKTYINLWCRFDWGTGDDSYQIKLFRAAASCGNNAYSPHVAAFAWFYTSGSSRIQWINKAPEYGMASTNLYTRLPHPKDRPAPVWLNLGMMIDARSTNGSVTVWSSDHRGGAMLKASRSGQVRTADATFDGMKIGEYVGNGGSGTTLFYDDIYVDNSWSRVELGDKPDYNTCTMREIQVPSQWSGSSVTVTMNQGAFDEGDQAYLFVVDGNNNVSRGYPATIGGQGQTRITTRSAKRMNGSMDGWMNGCFDVLGRSQMSNQGRGISSKGVWFTVGAGTRTRPKRTVIQ